jgi:hypothetical protein
MLWTRLILLLLLANALLIQIARIRYWNAVSTQRRVNSDDRTQPRKYFQRARVFTTRLRDRAISKFSPEL